MGESEVKSVALFFFFAFLEERRAVEASSQALALFFEKSKGKSSISKDALIVSSTFKIWNKFNSRVSRLRSHTFTEGGWVVPPDLDLGPWREFQKSATQDELLTLIWSKILGIPDGDIAVGLEITEGTVRYRLGRALRKLGAMSQEGSSKKLNVVK